MHIVTSHGGTFLRSASWQCRNGICERNGQSQGSTRTARPWAYQIHAARAGPQANGIRNAPSIIFSCSFVSTMRRLHGSTGAVGKLVGAAYLQHGKSRRRNGAHCPSGGQRQLCGFTGIVTSVGIDRSGDLSFSRRDTVR